MMSQNVKLENQNVWMEGNYSSKLIHLKNAVVIEGLSKLTETKVEFVSSDDSLDLQDLLASTITLGQLDVRDKERYFTGICVSVEYKGLQKGLSHFVADLRPWLWYLTRTNENRIFQEKTVLEIIQDVLNGPNYGFWSAIEKRTTATYKKRPYSVQYNETDFDFISRLMEEEGIYYYFIQDGKQLKMVLADSISAHKPTPGGSTFDFHFAEKTYRRSTEHIFDWSESTGITTAKVTLADYDFEKPSAERKFITKIPKGSFKTFENYRYPAHGRIEGIGETFAKIRAQAEALRHKGSQGTANIRTLGVGQTFELKGHPRKSNNIEFLITKAVHQLQSETDYQELNSKTPVSKNAIEVEGNNWDTYRVIFDVIPKKEDFRAPLNTPWPSISGIQTAIVTGPSGEEIHTDMYGRIKVQFHWDRLGKKDSKTTCWVRCVMPWTGKNWGMISVPRVGQEVAIQFEDGDPDRPICTGMLYHKETMPPYELPINKTQTGIKTRSSQKGDSNTFNELVFEDKKGEEFVRLQSEKNYTQVIKNNATVIIGVDKQDPGDLTQTIQHTKTETIKKGDHLLKVEEGNQNIFVKSDHTETIEGKATQTITKNYTQIVKTGDVMRKVSSGSEALMIAKGDLDFKTTAGSTSITAGKEIKLSVGANSIIIDNSGITINGTMITLQGKATVDVKSAMTTVSGDGMLTLKGGMTMIN
jgi:type VI secretion system secreted protein VgrG